MLGALIHFFMAAITNVASSISSFDWA